MMKFFRRIRQKLLGEGNLRRYLIYAIGEILLVMVGILLALQVNNWNENRKKELLEVELLKELKSNLQQDINDMKSNVFIHQQSINSANIILTVFERGLPENDSLNIHFARVPLVPQFLPTRSAYNNIQTEGIRIIKNESLRNSILKLYEKSYVFILTFSKSEWETAMNDYRSLYREKFSRLTKLHEEMEPMDYKKLQADMEYRNYLNNRIGILNTISGMYNNNVNRIQTLIEEIDKELSLH